jgi:hypothetical protein
VREIADRDRIDRVMDALARAAGRETQVYLVGGTTAVLLGWRTSTIDVDLVVRPEDESLLRAIPAIKERLQVNVEKERIGEIVTTLRHHRPVGAPGTSTLGRYSVSNVQSRSNRSNGGGVAAPAAPPSAVGHRHEPSVISGAFSTGHPSGRVNLNSPESRRMTRQPSSCTSRWWLRHSKTRLSPTESCVMTTRLASHARRRDVSAETRLPPARTD